MRKTLIIAMTACLAVVWIGSGMAQAGESANRHLYQPRLAPFGMTYPQWEGAYTKWFQEIPTSENPLVDPTSPRNCELQNGNVVFIGASGGNCHVPKGAAVAFSIAFWECSTAEGLGDTFEELQSCAKDNFAHDFSGATSKITMWLDGTRLRHARHWTFLTPDQVVDLPDDNLWRSPGGPTKSVTMGFFHIVRPLMAGDHKVHLHAEDSVFGTFDIYYAWHVG